MGSRYSFIAVFPVLLTILGVWSYQVEKTEPKESVTAQAPALESGSMASSKRRLLLETLDRIVAYEHYYRSVYGHFTQLISRIGVSIPSEVASSYDIRVSETSADRLLIMAFSEVGGKVSDLVSINQNFELHANFSVPLPRQEYLRLHALKQLRALREAPAGLAIEEQGVFHGFFRYEMRQDSQNQKIAFAVGIRPPVVGMQLEFGPSQARVFAQDESGGKPELIPEFAESQEVLSQGTGQKAQGDLMSANEQALLAQKIFHGEVGRYAKTWSELSRIAHFSFDGKDPADVPEIPEQVPVNRKIAQSLISELKTQEASRNSPSSTPGLEIEPIRSDE